MQLMENCPSCKKAKVFNQIHRSLIERVFWKNYYKCKCASCGAIVFSHRTHRKVILRKEGMEHT